MEIIRSNSTLPAILGGRAIIQAKDETSFRWPLIQNKHEEEVMRVLRSGELSSLKELKKFEAEFSSYVGAKHGLLFYNGTSAIFTALKAMGVTHGDEVLVTSATFWASVMPVFQCGAVPVFVDIEENSLGPDPIDIERKISYRTKAIIVVHLFGMPADMDEINALAKRYDIQVLEDASHAHGAIYKGRKVGVLGDAAVFSLQTSKLCPAGEGGILVTNSDEILENSILLGHYDRISELNTENSKYRVTGFGFHFRMSPLSAALARVELQDLDRNNRIKQDNIEHLSDHLMELGIHCYKSVDQTRRVYYEFHAKVDESKISFSIDDLTKSLVAEGLDIRRPRYPLLHKQPMFVENKWRDLIYDKEATHIKQRSYADLCLPTTERLIKSHIKLPNFPIENKDIIEKYISAFKKIFLHKDELAEYFYKEKINA